MIHSNRSEIRLQKIFIMRRMATTTNKLRPQKIMDEMTIGIASNGMVTPCADHIPDNSIRNLSILLWNFGPNRDERVKTLVNCLTKKCHQNLHKISIAGDLELKHFCEKIKNILSTVEAVTFHSRPGVVGDAKIFKYCPQVKTLTLCGDMHTKNVDAILKQNINQLTEFQYINGNTKNLDLTKLDMFLRKNNRVTRTTWKFCLFDNEARHRSVECLKTLNHLKHLTHLSLSLGTQLTEFNEEQFASISSVLTDVSNSSQLQQLELKLVGQLHLKWPYKKTDLLLQSRIHSLGGLKQLAKIHFRFFELSVMMPALREMTHLTTLVFTDSAFDYPYDDSCRCQGKCSCKCKCCTMECCNDCECRSKIYKDDYNHKRIGEDRLWNSTQMQLPQIKEVVIIPINQNIHRTYETCLLIMRHWKSVEKITIRNKTDYSSVFDVVELNETREELKDACRVTILMSNRRIDPTSRYECKLVRLKFVD